MSTEEIYINREISKARSSFVRAMIKKIGGVRVVKHMGEINLKDIPSKQIEQYRKQQKGNELIIEWHLFEMRKTGIQIVNQWRLVNDNLLNIKLFGFERAKRLKENHAGAKLELSQMTVEDQLKQFLNICSKHDCKVESIHKI